MTEINIDLSEFTEEIREIIRSIRLPELHIVHEKEVQDISVTAEEIDTVLRMNTPDYVLEQSEFAAPTIILPESVPDAATLWQHREDVRMLRYVPNKSPSMYKYYHLDFVQQKMPTEVESYFADGNNFAFVNNMYPYSLPPGVKQYIAWMKKMDTPRRETAQFIACCARFLSLELSQLLIFERPIGKTAVKMVRGSFPVYRHVHVWWV